MKTILALATGFWLGRQVILQFEKKTAAQYEAEIARLRKELASHTKSNN